MLPEAAMPLTVVFAVAGVTVSTVVAWFQGARGRQPTTITEWVLLGVIAVAWLAVSAWIVMGSTDLSRLLPG